MKVGSWLLWGFVATVVLTTIMSGSQGLRLTRMNLPYLLGTAITPDRARAKRLGFLVHLGNGWLFALLYVAAFHAWGGATLFRGALVGFVHAAFVLTAGMQLLPAFHPRMAPAHGGPDVTPALEPPGLAALNYGTRTPISVLLAHLVYGGILGTFY